MKKHIKLVDNKNGSVIYQGDANISRSRSGAEVYAFSDGSRNFEIKLYDEACLIRQESEIASFIPVFKNRTTKGHADTEFGRIDLNVEALNYTRLKDETLIEYRLLDGDGMQEFSFSLYHPLKED